MRNVAFSARNREFSASRSLTARRLPLLIGRPSSDSLIQFASVLTDIPSFRAAPAAPRLSASNTPWALYSAVY